MASAVSVVVPNRRLTADLLVASRGLFDPLPGGFEPDRIAARRTGRPTCAASPSGPNDVGPAEQLIGRHRQPAATVSGTKPRPGYRQPAPTESDRPSRARCWVARRPGSPQGGLSGDTPSRRRRSSWRPSPPVPVPTAIASRPYHISPASSAIATVTVPGSTGVLAGRSILLAALISSGRLFWVDLAVAQHLPQGGVREDRHLICRESRDNLDL